MTTGAKPNAEVGVKIVIDSNAQQQFNHIKNGLKGIEDEAGKAKKKIDVSLGANMKSMGMLAAGGIGLATSAIFGLTAGIVGMGVHAAHTMHETDMAIRQVAGSLMLVDQNANAFEDLYKAAEDVENAMDEISIASGAAGDALMATFTDVVERGGKTVEQARALTEEMAHAGKAIPGGVQMLGAGFEQIQMGMVRAKNPIVGIISATKTLEGSAKSVAKQMQKMSIAEQMELAEKAIGKMATKMREAPLTLGQMKTAMGTMADNIGEAMGKPILAKLDPIVKNFYDRFVANQDRLNDLGEQIGNNLAKPLEFVLPLVENIFKYANENAHEINEVMTELTQPMKDVFTYIYENKDAFAKTFVEVFIEVAKAMAMIMKAMQALYRGLAAAASFVGRTVSSDYNKFAGEEDLKGQAKDIRGKVSGYRDPSLTDKEAAKQKFVASYTETYGQDKIADAMAQFDATWQRAVDDHVAVMKIARENEQAARLADTASFVKAWNAASKAQDAGAMVYITRFLQHNQALVKALAEDGPRLLGEGFGALIDTLKGQNAADIAAAIKAGTKPNLGISPKSNIIQNFNGPINVKQDFRDQDPDQIMVMMKRDFAKAGVNRLQSKLSGIYGF